MAKKKAKKKATKKPPRTGDICLACYRTAVEAAREEGSQ